MTIKFKKSAPGYAYFGDEIATLLPEQEAQLVNDGFAILIPETEAIKNTLPIDLPCRSILFNEGLETIKDITRVIDTLTEIPGISKISAKKIADYIASA